ncbi:hypothetical protein [Roseibacillus ishigakijimensis]|uniref:Uncharacterized protein n=1 Tax=Roseibacillus ishigakijimensis TaxID=454146 RepID=A0A934VMF9_9BACT|nr:hypothetical protein [Roseibacillus ishigakijimensis]
MERDSPCGRPDEGALNIFPQIYNFYSNWVESVGGNELQHPNFSPREMDAIDLNFGGGSETENGPLDIGQPKEKDSAVD